MLHDLEHLTMQILIQRYNIFVLSIRFIILKLIFILL